MCTAAAGASPSPNGGAGRGLVWGAPRRSALSLDHRSGSALQRLGAGGHSRHDRSHHHSHHHRHHHRRHTHGRHRHQGRYGGRVRQRLGAESWGYGRRRRWRQHQQQHWRRRRRQQRHRFDADPAEVAPPRSSRNTALLRALAAVQGAGCRLALGESGPDGASLTYMRAARASDAELVRAGWRVKATEKDVELACRAMGALAEPTSAATEGALLRALAAHIDTALGRFPASLEQDEARLEGRDGCERVEGPERLALVALASQQRALLGSRLVVAGWLAKLEAGCPVAELYDDEYDAFGDVWGEGEAEPGDGSETDGWGGSQGR